MEFIHLRCHPLWACMAQGNQAREKWGVHSDGKSYTAWGKHLQIKMPMVLSGTIRWEGWRAQSTDVRQEPDPTCIARP